MTSEVCPFCGKTYKRLKSHLPHCKAAASSKTALTQRDATSKEPSSCQLATALSMETLSVTDLHTKKIKKACVISSKRSQLPTPATPLKSVNTSSSSQSLSLSSTSLPPSAKKKKTKLVDQIKMANTPSSATASLISAPSPVMSEPTHKSLRALIEAAKSKHISKGSLEGATSASEDLLSHLNTRTTAQTKINSEKDSVRDVCLLTDTKPTEVPKKKVSKTKKPAESSSTTKTAPDSQDVNINETSTRPHTRDLWVDNEGGIENLSMSKTFLKSRSGHQARITIQDVKATLRRAKATNQSSRSRILSQIETVGDLSSLSPVIGPAERQKESCVVTAKPLSDMLPSTSSQHAELQSDKNKSLKSEQGSSVRLPVPQPKLNSPATPLLSGPLSSQVTQPAPCSHTISASDRLKVGQYMTRLLSLSPIQFFSPHPFLLPPPVRVETLRAGEVATPEKSQLDVGKQTTAQSRTEGALTQRQLGQVRLTELPEWLACKTPRNPRDVVEMVQRDQSSRPPDCVFLCDSVLHHLALSKGWQWYHRRYIDVKKGGVGGLSMLLAGYCVLSYIWSYPHIKHDRWRKYH